MGGGGISAAGWTGRRRDPHLASKGTTTRGIGSALCAGKAKAHDAMKAVIRSLIAPFLLILQRHAVAAAASSGLRPIAWSGFGIGNAAVGQNNGITNGIDLFRAIAFSHVFQLNNWPDRYGL